MSRLSRRLQKLFSPSRVSREIDDEMRFHIEKEAEDLVAAGVPANEAYRRARVAFGGVDRYAEEARDGWPLRWVQQMLIDFRYGARQLRRNGTLTAAALICFALGIGATTSIFSVVNAVLVRPLPFPDAGSLVLVSEGTTKISNDIGSISPPDLIEFREAEGKAFDAIGLAQNRNGLLAPASPNGDPELVTGVAMTPSAFRVLRSPTLLGRTFLDEDAIPGGPPRVILSEALWRRRGADTAIVGKNITYQSGRTAEVVGVMPASFRFPLPGIGLTPNAEIFFPFAFTPQVMATRADNYNGIAIGRLRDGVTVEQAEATLRPIAASLATRYPESHGKMAARNDQLLVHVKPLDVASTGSSRRPLLTLLIAVAFVLLIACINVASLFVARASARQREITIRRALGATRARLTMELLAEALVLVGTGSVLGLIAARWGTSALVALAPNSFYRAFNPSIDGTVLAVTLLVTIATAVVFALLPNTKQATESQGQTLRDDSRGATASAPRSRMRRALIVAEVAIALVLTVGAGLMIRSFDRVRSVNPGFDAGHLTNFFVSLPATRYADAERVKLAEADLVGRLRAIPGVLGASAGTNMPMLSLWQVTFTPEGTELPSLPVAANNLVMPGYFDAMGMAMRAGRGFTPEDARGSQPVTVISETIAKKYYGGGEAVGRQFKWGPRDSPDPWRTIVGVVADVKQQRLDEDPMMSVYFPTLQMDTAASALGMYRGLYYTVRSNTPAALTAQIRGVLRDFDAQLIPFSLGPVGDVVGATMADRRFNTVLLSLFAGLALVLAATGVYGVMQYSVLQQTREIGIRVAIGAGRGAVLTMIVGDAVKLTIVGVVLGLAGSLALTRSIQALLYDTSPVDVVTFAASAGMLVMVAIASSYLPARRALKIDPVEAIK